jgi:hypothetical protein
MKAMPEPVYSHSRINGDNEHNTIIQKFKRNKLERIHLLIMTNNKI